MNRFQTDSNRFCLPKIVRKCKVVSNLSSGWPRQVLTVMSILERQVDAPVESDRKRITELAAVKILYGT